MGPGAAGQGGHDPEAVERPERDQGKEQRHLQIEEAPVAGVEQALPAAGEVEGAGQPGDRDQAEHRRG